MLSRIPLTRIPNLIVEIEEAISSSEVKGRVSIPLLAPNAGEMVEKAQDTTMLHLNRLMDGGQLVAKLRLMQEEALISSGISNMQHELQAGKAWLEVAVNLLDEATSGESQEVPFFSDTKAAQTTEISFSALNSDDQDRVDRMIQRAEVMVEQIQKKIENSMEGTTIELEDKDMETLKTLVPSVRYGLESKS